MYIGIWCQTCRSTGVSTRVYVRACVDTDT
nr:MAG TPA: NrdH-redoxin family protein [Caudoviricetes sp.]